MKARTPSLYAIATHSHEILNINRIGRKHALPRNAEAGPYNTATGFTEALATWARSHAAQDSTSRCPWSARQAGHRADSRRLSQRCCECPQPHMYVGIADPDAGSASSRSLLAEVKRPTASSGARSFVALSPANDSAFAKLRYSLKTAKATHNGWRPPYRCIDTVVDEGSTLSMGVGGSHSFPGESASERPSPTQLVSTFNSFGKSNGLEI